MTALLIVIAITLTILLCFSSLLQLLYLEALRLRTRDIASLQYFKSTLEDLIGRDTEYGATAFSIIKHSALSLLGVVFLAITAWTAVRVWEGILAAAILSWVDMLVFSYLIPQLLYRRTKLHWLCALVPAAKALVLIASPFSWVLTFLYSLAELGSRSEEHREAPDAAEHIEALISAGEEEGLIEEDDRKLIQSVVAFGDKTVREVMTPRPNIVAIDANRSLEELRQLVIHEQYSRIPVYDAHIDQIVGFVHVRDMFEVDQNDRKSRKVRELVRLVRIV
jgi:putative hemolysin